MNIESFENANHATNQSLFHSLPQFTEGNAEWRQAVAANNVHSDGDNIPTLSIVGTAGVAENPNLTFPGRRPNSENEHHGTTNPLANIVSDEMPNPLLSSYLPEYDDERPGSVQEIGVRRAADGSVQEIGVRTDDERPGASPGIEGRRLGLPPSGGRTGNSDSPTGDRAHPSAEPDEDSGEGTTPPVRNIDRLHGEVRTAMPIDRQHGEVRTAVPIDRQHGEVRTAVPVGQTTETEEQGPNRLGTGEQQQRMEDLQLGLGLSIHQQDAGHNRLLSR